MKDKIEIKRVVEGDEWESFLDKAFLEKNKNVTIKGFRKGKASKEVYINKFGIESLYENAIYEASNKYFDGVIEEVKDKDVVGRPSLEIGEISPESCELIFTFLTKPEVKLKKYKDLDVTKEKATVTDEEVENEMKTLLDQYTECNTKDGKAAMGNIVNIDFSGSKDGEEIENTSSDNYDLELGSNSFIPGFEDELVGLAAGDEKDFDIKFPDDYPAEDMASKVVTFHVKVNKVEEKIARELDESFFKDLNIEGVDDEASLRKHLKDQIKKDKEEHIDKHWTDDLLKALGENVEVELSKEMVDGEINKLKSYYIHTLSNQGIDFNIYLTMMGKTEEEFDEELRESAEANLRERFALEEVTKLENVKVTKKDLDNKIDELVSIYNLPKDAILSEYGGEEGLSQYLVIEKTIDKLKELNK